MFKAFDRVHKVREQVISTLGEYPDLLDSVERLLRLYKDDAMLQRRATALYVALLVAIEGMIIWFEERTCESAVRICKHLPTSSPNTLWYREETQSIYATGIVRERS